MNLMFRKNFKEQRSGGGKSGGGKAGAGRHSNKRSSREPGYTPIEEFHYRTHLFFSPPRSAYDPNNEEPRCGPMTGSDQGLVPQVATTTASCENEAPQSLIMRSTTSSLLKWPQTPTKSPSRQVNFNQINGEYRATVAGLDRDCFIIPIHSLDRFLPAGVPIPKPSLSGQMDSTDPGLHIMEVPDPKLCILCHLMSPLEPLSTNIETPTIQPMVKQRTVAEELLTEIGTTRTAVTGMLLANMERNSDFQFISYFLINSAQTNPVNFYNNVRTASLTKFDPRMTRFTAAHTLDLYSEVASIYRPPIQEIGTSLTKCHTPATGYLISVYKVFEGDDKEKFERNWLYWTGARMIYRYLPTRAGLKRITLHKSLSAKGDKMYILICECSNLLDDITVCALLLPALRARLTGYTGIFRPIQTI